MSSRDPNFLFFKDTSHIGLESTDMTLFYLNWFFKGPVVSKYSHILSYWRVGLQNMDLDGDIIHPVTYVSYAKHKIILK